MKAMSETEWDERGAFLRCTRTTGVILSYSASVKCALGAARFCSEAALLRPTATRRSRQMVPIENINYEAIKQIGSRPRSPINLWPLFLPFSASPSLRPRPPASSTRTTYKILSSSAAAAVPEHERESGRAAVSLYRHEPHNNFRFPIKSLSCGALLPLPGQCGQRRWGRAGTVSFRLVFPKQCGPINYSHARASEASVGVAVGREARDSGGEAVITS